MDFFSVLAFLGGLAMFLYGMDTMCGALEAAAAGTVRRRLSRLTDSPLKGALLGAAVTAAVQSSSAVTVLTVGLVNAKAMKLPQAVGVIMGANVGTTVTAWILSLAGLEGERFWQRLLRPESCAAALAVAGVSLMLFAGRGGKRRIGVILAGFSVLLFGMSTMRDAVSPLAQLPAFGEALTAFSNPFLGVLTGAAVTAVMQSSSASVGILQALAASGGVTCGSAVPILMGQNIGTCATAFLAAAGAGADARRAAMVHFYFNAIGAAIFLILFYLLNAAFGLGLLSLPVGAAGVAAIHTLFNLLSTAALLPFSGQLARLARASVRGGRGKAHKIRTPRKSRVI